MDFNLFIGLLSSLDVFTKVQDAFLKGWMRREKPTIVLQNHGTVLVYHEYSVPTKYYDGLDRAKWSQAALSIFIFKMLTVQ